MRYPRALTKHVVSIEDNALHAFVEQALQDAPEGWDVLPSKMEGFRHPPDERCRGGRLIHCLKLCSLVGHAARWLERSCGPQIVVAGGWRDFWIAASIIHDLWWSEDTLLHPEIAADAVIQANTHWWELAGAVRTHMGPWGVYPPSTSFGRLFHMADFWVSRENVSVDWNAGS